jgi:hypothetical protein
MMIFATPFYLFSGSNCTVLQPYLREYLIPELVATRERLLVVFHTWNQLIGLAYCAVLVILHPLQVYSMSQVLFALQCIWLNTLGI